MRMFVLLLGAALCVLLFPADAINHHHGDVVEEDNDFAEFEDFDDGKKFLGLKDQGQTLVTIIEIVQVYYIEKL